MGMGMKEKLMTESIRSLSITKTNTRSGRRSKTPLGWNDVGKTGPKQEVLDYIQEVWTDMRPLSLRKKMEEMEREREK